MTDESHQPVLVVDAGNLLFDKNLRGEDSTSTAISLLIAHGLVRAYRAMSYDAVAVSASDLSAGAEFFKQTSKGGLPWVAANIYDNHGHLLFPPHIIKQLGAMKIGIIGLTGNNAPPGDCTIGDWRVSLQKEVALLEKSCDMLVVLSSLSDSENREMQRDFNEVDIVVAADIKSNNTRPKAVGSSLLVQSGGRGKYLGKLDITWHSQGLWREDSNRRPRPQNKEQLQKSYRASFLPVIPAASMDSVDATVLEIKKSIAAYNRYRLSDLQATDPAIQLALQQNDIGGSDACTSCHEKQSAFWGNTVHASAYTTLEEQGQSYNLQCLACHVTGGRISASSPESERLYLLYLSAARQAVGCEACHGPGKRHILSPAENSPVRLPTAAVCTLCHTSERDSNFNYQKKMAAIACPAD